VEVARTAALEASFDRAETSRNQATAVNLIAKMVKGTSFVTSVGVPRKHAAGSLGRHSWTRKKATPTVTRMRKSIGRHNGAMAVACGPLSKTAQLLPAK
jgi:hypothetical protein